MRRPGAYRASSASALNEAQTRPLSPVHSQRSLSLLRLLAVVSAIGSQFHSALCTASVETAGTTLSTQQNIANTRNIFFDDHNATRATSSTVGSLAATSTTLYASLLQNQTQTKSQTQSQTQSAFEAVSQMPAPLANHTEFRLGQVPLQPSESNSNSITQSAQIPNTINFDRSGATTTDLLPTSGPSTGAESGIGIGNGIGTMPGAQSTKSARSTVKQPSESTRSRNHWAMGATVHETERPRTFRSKHHHEHHWGPFFEEPLSSAASGESLVSAVHLFTEAVLNCRVGMLKDKTVMWIRRTAEKVSLLTVGNVTYSGDPRIRVKFQYPNNWRLLINPTQREDAGMYMCQVSTHPPRLFTTNLTILEPPLRIIDEHERDIGDRYYKSGSTVDLQCQISRIFFQKERHNILKSAEPQKYAMPKDLNLTSSELNLIGDTNQTLLKLPGQSLEKYFTNFITWAKDEEQLQELTNKRSSVSEKWLTSRISIGDAKLSDSGNYSCSLGRLFTVIVQVQVLTG
ncbi:hypothetical protein KR009_010942, partial [Drosophila setifemur]